MVIDSVIRGNLMKEKYYTPYCGSDKCTFNWPRSKFNGEQFQCHCGWQSSFEEEFIKQYKEKWGIK
jgi:hypothetical protein